MFINPSLTEIITNTGVQNRQYINKYVINILQFFFFFQVYTKYNFTVILTLFIIISMPYDGYINYKQ